MFGAKSKSDICCLCKESCDNSITTHSGYETTYVFHEACVVNTLENYSLLPHDIVDIALYISDRVKEERKITNARKEKIDESLDFWAEGEMKLRNKTLPRSV